MEVEIKYKKCTCCGGEFPATEEYWYKHKRSKYGLNSKCKRCYKEYGQRLEVKERKSKRQRLRYNSDDLYRKTILEKRMLRRESIAEYKHQWEKNNPEYHNIRYKNNSEKIKEHRRKVVDELRPYYVASSMRRSVNDLTPEIIETKRLIIQLKRELKNNNVKIR